jgi:catechol 2,3-dioxygenase
MPLPQINHNPEFNIVRISHVELGVTDIDRARHFYRDIVGYYLEDDLGDRLYMHGQEEVNHHSLVLSQSEQPVVRRLAFKVYSEADLDRADSFFSAQNCPTAWVDRYAQGRTLHVTDPWGVPLEFYAQMEPAREHLLQKYGHFQHGTRLQRIDHVNIFHPDVNAAVKFYVESLGFRITETTVRDKSDPDSDQIATWLHRRGGVHDIAFTNGLGPRMHHLGIYTPTATDIINFCDLLASTGHTDAFERGPGRHGISNAFFLYIRDADGHRLEPFTSDYMTVDPDHPPRIWNLDDPQRQTLWGQAAPRSWFEEGIPFEGLAPVESVLQDVTPIIAPD